MPRSKQPDLCSSPDYSPRLLVPVFAFFLALVALTACLDEQESADPWDNGDSDNHSSTDGDVDRETSPDGDSEGEANDDNRDFSPETLSGLWAMKFCIAYTVVLPVFNQKVQMLISGIARIEAEMDGTDMHFTEHICDFSTKIVEDIDFNVIFPLETIEAIPAAARHAAFSELAENAVFQTSPAHDIYGVDPTLFDDPHSDPLPDDPDDPRVIDFEEDGNPGITARISGIVQGEVYVIMRMMRDMTGRIVNNRLIEGQIDSSVEMITLDAKPSLIKLQLDLVPHPVPDLNRFEFIRLQSDLNCEDIFAREGELFSYDPMDYAVPLESD